MTVLDPQAITFWEAELADALTSHDKAEQVLIAAKARCDAECAGKRLVDAVQAVVPAEEWEAVAHAGVTAAGRPYLSPDVWESAVFAEEAAHLPHKASLEAAYAEFGRVATAELNLKRARFGLPPVGSNPASGTTPIGADVAVASEVSPPA